MRKESRPSWVKRLHRRYKRVWSQHFLEPHFDAIGPYADVADPKHVQVYGPNIRVGRCATLRTTPAYPITLTVWTSADREGRIDIGDYVLISPGTRVLSSDHITIGSNTMIAGETYISDSDWHDVYNRTQECDAHKPVHIGQNVWLGYGVKICKGVSIGDNSVIGAGSVVSKSIPANVIAAGNPARTLRELDPDKGFTRREDMYADPEKLIFEMEKLERYLLRDNTIWSWLRARIMPNRTD